MEEKRPNHRPPKERMIDPSLIEERGFYTINEVATLLKFHHQTVRKMIREGELQAKKIGKEWRIKGADLDRLTGSN